MNPEILLWQLYRTNRICLRELMTMSQTVIQQMYLTARISLPECKTLLEWMEGKAKSKKRVRKRAKTDDKPADAAQ